MERVAEVIFADRGWIQRTLAWLETILEKSGNCIRSTWGFDGVRTANRTASLHIYKFLRIFGRHVQSACERVTVLSDTICACGGTDDGEQEDYCL